MTAMPRKLFGGKRRSRMRGGQSCPPGDCGINFGGVKDPQTSLQNGGTHLPLSPVSLSGDSFDRSGAQLANTAHAVYVQKNIDLASIKNVNAMKGGQMMRLKGGQMMLLKGGQMMRRAKGGRRSRRTAKKYSRSRSRRSGGGLVEAVVPLGLLAAQQTLFKRGSSKNKRHNKYGGSRCRSRSRRN